MRKDVVPSSTKSIHKLSSGTEVQNFRYVECDCLQSGISQGVLIIEADKNSGTMHTADYATKQYKRLVCYYHKRLEISSGNYVKKLKKSRYNDGNMIN